MTGPASVGSVPTIPLGAPRSDLGEIESRMRRLLSLDGLVPLGWQGEIIPVCVVGDGMLPGMGSTRLRYFLSNSQTGGAGTGYWYKAEGADLIIDQIFLTMSAGTSYVVRYLGPLEADPVAITLADSPLVDRAQTSGERASLLRSAVVAGAGGVTLWSSNGINMPVGQHRILDRSFCLAAGAKIHVQGAAAMVIQVSGRLF